MKNETLLMVDLTEAEEKLIRRLTRSFDIKTESVKKNSPVNYPELFHEKQICLVIINTDQDRIKKVQQIRRIKKLLYVPVPILVLVSAERSSNIYRYIKAGADDYIIMPLNEESFAMRFYVLLECGQAILQRVDGNKILDINNHEDNHHEKNKKYPSNEKKAAWNLIVGYLQEGLSFFAPRSQFARRGKRPILNKWQPVRKLATGGDGVIWLVKELGRDREAVAKIPHSSMLNINSLRAAAVLKRLVYHPNIVHLVEVVKDKEKFILIQEYVEGCTLSELMESKSISSVEKESLFLQLLSVIAYSHDHKIMHRDIKPDNIMVKSDGRLKLLDFGSAKEIAWVDCNRSPEGTLNFMPPEQLEGKTCLASDVWALGIILYLFCTNRLPFYQDNSYYPMDIETKMVAVPPSDIRSDISIQLEQVIMRCLEEKLEKRYKNASELRDDLLKIFPNFGNGMQIPQLC
ncbi:MAG: protein kinase [Desulfamplus sp.]|nr:protein kinase [Desulfamplus sp.]